MARQQLSRERVLAAATELADREGIAALTIRAVANRLGSAPMAVYHHVAGKDEILDGLVDTVFAEIDEPVPGQPWRPELARRSRSARAALARHPWAAPLLDSRRRPGHATLAQHDAVLGTLLSDGFDLPAAGHAFALLDAFVYGFALQEAALPFAPDTIEAGAQEIVAALPDGSYPHLARFAAERIGPGYAFGDEFDVGLELVLDAIGTLRAAVPGVPR
ncbi:MULTISPECIES: TetR/AcrR family transcriptional regulator [Pseudonocardia]|uniref:Tetracycline repressor protein class B from transposon Tn10 n=2 Tax=Pseudonocardia TaxID=1847 RepID=A0A1Y2MIH8_PSEAH|nr:MULTISPECIES: TetR/AcrR family transcriptional regulator C-terminal domain-containing protein [Pseudonocardia]OSY34962.1 Tetracycline repressor protein class B from transposon Tn10 [Pseudonocardia autotrophica]TDN72556.1 TetR family transcriptional regulator [Pseudonocardia autotrophica]BBG03264.1 TetR family transcriptional regulator [Pseudonocardia autotrophica]GEC24522.1 TetR family transcriptional regulator [Pseudonocardia saturnea]